MGIKIEQTGVKGLLLLVVLVIALSEVSTAQRKIDCRKFVFAPPCRGIAAKRDTHSRLTDTRFNAPFEDAMNSIADYAIETRKSASSENDINMGGLLGLLKKAISKNVELDTGTNYLA